jgi:hypothetical protein
MTRGDDARVVRSGGKSTAATPDTVGSSAVADDDPCATGDTSAVAEGTSPNAPRAISASSFAPRSCPR